MRAPTLLECLNRKARSAVRECGREAVELNPDCRAAIAACTMGGGVPQVDAAVSLVYMRL